MPHREWERLARGPMSLGARMERATSVLPARQERGRRPHCCRFVFLPTFISGLVYFSLKRGCYAKSRPQISCECVILQLLPGRFCDLGNNEGNINKQRQRQLSEEALELHVSVLR